MTAAITSYTTMLWQHDAYEDPRQCNTVPRILIITNGALSYKAAHTAAMMAEADVYATHYVSLSSIGPMKSTWKLGCGCFCADPIQRSITIIPTLHSMLWICIFIRPRTVDSNWHLTKHWQDKSLGGEQWRLQQKTRKWIKTTIKKRHAGWPGMTVATTKQHQEIRLNCNNQPTAASAKK